MAWRRQSGWTQQELAAEAGLTRPYLSRLEKGMVDPALSVLRQLAAALEIGVGQLVEDLPPERTLSRDEMDRLARGALRPGTREARLMPETRILASMIHERRRALGLHAARGKRGRVTPQRASAIHAARWLRASLGEAQWKALLRRIDKLASLASETS
ncbi:MAG TPA: helix-turn-helix transcriptional regulator [Terriglobia bacterium]|nr:helix-turn-helix transcriptional regulator [Terriglobia bacterium]